MVVEGQHLRCCTAALVGAAVSTAHPLGIAAAVAMPALALSQESRYGSYAAALSYYGAALWPLIPGARNFFGPDVSALAAVALWIISSLLLALPWLLMWSPDKRQAIWRAPAGITLTVLPPLGIIGWASPLTAAGILFPGMAWSGLILCDVLSGALVLWQAEPIAAVLVLVSITCNVAAWSDGDPRRPPEWQTVNTAFGAIAHGAKNPIVEYRAAQWIQQKAQTATSKVIVFPETVVPTWTPATDAFWRQTLDRLRASGKTILVGARVPLPSASTIRKRYDFSGDLAALKGARPRIVPIVDAKPESAADPVFAFDNAVILRGAETDCFRQRVPVPIGMWNPLKPAAARLHISGPGVINIHGERAAIVICYEQLLTFPILASMAEHPTVLIAVANDYWVTGTPIPRFQLASVHAWARLFRLPYLSAVNQ